MDYYYVICWLWGSCVVYTRICDVDCCHISGEALSLSAQGSLQWINVLQSYCGEALVSSVQGLCSILLFINGQAFALHAQGFVQWIAILQSGCGEDLALSVRGLCCGDALVLST